MISGQRPAVRLRQHVERGRTLNLEAVELAAARRVDGRPLVAVELHVVAAGLGVELHPVVSRGPPDEPDAVLVEEEQDRVADHVPVGRARDELLRLADREVLEGVDAEIGEQPDHVGPLDRQVRHVMRLVEERRRLAPADLLVAPVRELGRNLRVDVRPDLRVAGELDRAPDRLQNVLQAALTHLRKTPPHARWESMVGQPATARRSDAPRSSSSADPSSSTNRRFSSARRACSRPRSSARVPWPSRIAAISPRW